MPETTTKPPPRPRKAKTPESAAAWRQNATKPRGGKGLVPYAVKVRPALKAWLDSIEADGVREILEKACSEAMVV